MNVDPEDRRQDMATKSTARIPIRRSLRIALTLALLVAGAALADRVVDASDPIIISNDISNHVTEVISLTGGPGS